VAAGEGVALSDVASVTIEARKPADFLLFDLN
jgi:hypothetical protein